MFLYKSRRISTSHFMMESRLVQEHCHVWRNHHVPRHPRTVRKGNESPCTTRHGHQGHCSTLAKILSLDWWIHPCFSLHFRRNVGHQGRVRRIWPNHRPQEMHLNTLSTKRCRAFSKTFRRLLKERISTYRRLHFLSKRCSRSAPCFA